MKERKRQTEMSVEGREDVYEYVWRKKREREGEREGRSDGGTGRTEVSLFLCVCVCFQKKRLPAVSLSVVRSIQIIISMHPSL